MAILDRVTRLFNRGSGSAPTRASADFMGDVFVSNFLFERFNLTDDDFERLTAELPPELKDPARFWITLYGTWLFRLGLRDEHGEEYWNHVLVAAKRRLSRKVEGFDGEPFIEAFDFWFKILDKASKDAAESGATHQGVEIPMDVLAAWSFLGLDASSPHFGDRDVPGSGIDFAVADCLNKAKVPIARFIEFALKYPGPEST